MGKAENWLDDFHIPERPSFSIAVQQSIDSGVISSKARSEIVRVLRTLMLQKTQRPNHVQYETDYMLIYRNLA